MLHRDVDHSGMSGTGSIAEGVEWTDGEVVLRWRGAKGSTCLWRSIDDLLDIHGHRGSTRVVWDE